MLKFLFIIFLISTLALAQIAPIDHELERILSARDTDGTQSWPEDPDRKDIDYLGRMSFGHGFTIATHGNIAFYNKYHILEIADISNPKNIKIISRLRTLERITAIAWEHDKLYIANWGRGVRVIDVSDLENPVILGSHEVPASLREISVVDGIIYVAASTNGLQIFDATDPTDIKLLSSFPVERESTRIASDGKRAYLTEFNKLHVFDVSDPRNPKELSVYDSSPSEIKNLIIENDTLYTAQDFGTLHILDATDPTNLKEITKFDTKGRSWQIKKKGNTLYIADEFKLSIIDVTDLDDIQMTGEYFGNFLAMYDFDFLGDLIVTLDFNRGLSVINPKNPKGPILEGFLETYGNANCIARFGDYAYIGNFVGLDTSAVRIINIKDKELPYEVNTIWRAHRAPLHLVVRDSLLYMADAFEGFKIFELDDPVHPKLLSQFASGVDNKRISFHDTLALVATYPGFIIINIKDPANIKVILDGRGLSDVNGVAIRGDFLYAVHFSKISSWNIKNLSHPVYTSTLQLYESVLDLEIKDNYAYIPVGGSGLKIVDISDPRDMKLVAHLWDGYGADIQIIDNLAFMAAGDVFVIDISDPLHPEKIAWYDTDWTTLKIDVQGEYIYTASEYDGMYILKYNPVTGISEVTNRQPNTYNLKQNYPNPFNATTTVEFSLEEKSHVSLAVFNTAGKQVVELSSKVYTQGTHTLNWDAGNLGSGVYFIRIKSEPLGAGSQPFIRTIKSILIK